MKDFKVWLGNEGDRNRFQEESFKASDKTKAVSVAHSIAENIGMKVIEVYPAL